MGRAITFFFGVFIAHSPLASSVLTTLDGLPRSSECESSFRLPRRGIRHRLMIRTAPTCSVERAVHLPHCEGMSGNLAVSAFDLS